MSIVIIGGHERMETQYKQICKQYKCKAKVFTKICCNGVKDQYDAVIIDCISCV